MRSADEIAPYLEDAAHYRGGRSACLFFPESEAEIAEVLRQQAAVLPIGSQSSLTGGATPFGETLISTARLKDLQVADERVTAGAGVILSNLDAALAAVGHYYPPLPTFTGATAGGVVATNAAGAATFKHGATRPWVEALTVVLASGDVLDLERGRCFASTTGSFAIDLPGGRVDVQVPSYRMPDVAKLSAGLFSRPGMDLVDLLIGAEGTLGIVTAVTFRVLTARPASCLVFVCFDRRADAYACAARLRDAAHESWSSHGAAGIDVSAIEHVDARCLQLLRDAGIDRRESIALPESADMALLIGLELEPSTTSADVYEAIGAWSRGAARSTPLTRLCSMVDDYDVLGRAEVAPPGDHARTAQLLRVREWVPTLVNQQVKHASTTADSRIEKVAADVAVPFHELPALDAFIAAEFSRRGLDGAVWGHLSDGNVHPNVMARSGAELEQGREAMLAIGREAIRLGGTPLAEHGVGRNPIKQQLLRELYGESAIEEMRRVKRALDPQWKLSPGVIFSR